MNGLEFERVGARCLMERGRLCAFVEALVYSASVGHRSSVRCFPLRVLLLLAAAGKSRCFRGVKQP